MKIIRLENSNNKIFDKICEWNYNWWGIRNHESFEEVKCGLEHSLNTDRLPQTFVALIDNEPVGMYQLSMCEDLNSRPDIYPWLINVYVDEFYRGNHVCRELMKTVEEKMQCIDKLREVATKNTTEIKDIERRIEIYKQILFVVGTGAAIALITEIITIISFPRNSTKK